MDESFGTLYIVSTPIGNLNDITFRASKVLADANAIVAEDTRKASVLLKHLNINKPLVSYHAHNEHRKTTELIRRLQGGETLALISDAGTPGISDPGFYIVRECIRQRIPVVPIPGPAAFLAALTVSGLPMERFVFEGFLPHKKGRKTRIKSLKDEDRTIIFYESPHRILKTLRELREALGNRQAVICRELTKVFEEVVRGNLQDVEEHFKTGTLKGEFVLIVGGASYTHTSPETMP
jgi:16S rRNA (cytidine1402-2'-O)-methyltransferase